MNRFRYLGWDSAHEVAAPGTTQEKTPVSSPERVGMDAFRIALGPARVAFVYVPIELGLEDNSNRRYGKAHDDGQ
jgi:hypothetical protein